MGRIREIELPWTQQPQEAVGVDWRNPITDGLVFAWSAAEPMRDAAGGVRILGGPGEPGITTTVGADGLQTTFTGAQGADSFVTADPWRGLVGARQSTVDLLLYVSTGGANFRPLAQYGGSDASLSHQVRGSWGDMEWTAAKSSAYSCRFYAANMFATAGWYRLTMAWYGRNAHAIVANGSLRNTAVIEWEDIAGGDVGEPLRLASNVTDKLAGRMVYARIWRRGLHLDEMMALQANPWQIFAPIERRIWVPGEAPGGVPSITAVYADSVTTSSVVPRVTLDFA